MPTVWNVCKSYQVVGGVFNKRTIFSAQTVELYVLPYLALSHSSSKLQYVYMYVWVRKLWISH